MILVCAGVSLLNAGLSVPVIRGWVKPNLWYGLRVRQTLDNPDIWYPANRYAGWLLLAYGLALLVVSPGLPIILGGLAGERAEHVYGLIMAALMLTGLLPLVVLSLRHVRRLAQEQDTSERD